MQLFATEFLTTLLLFVVVLSFIVFIHELGHFLPARYFGVRVATFSIGFGPEIFGWTDAKGTRWKFSWIPFGGYVRFYGDLDASSTTVDASLSDDEKKFSLHYRPVWQRAIVSFGGPLANYLLAIALFFGTFFMAGQAGMSSRIESFGDGSPAQAAGVLVGDEIKSINSTPVHTLPDIMESMAKLTSPQVNLVVNRNGTEHTFMLMASTLKTGDKERYILGIKTGPGPAYQFASSLKLAALYPVEISVATLVAIKNMILKTNVEGLGGPIAMAKGIKSAADMGIAAIIFYAAMISTSLGFFNLLPIPMLDGGHLLFQGIEAIRRKPVSEKVQEWALSIGLAILGLLTLFVTYKDVFLK